VLKCSSYSSRTSRAWAVFTIRTWSSSSRRTLPTKRSAIAFARGARTGIWMTSAPTEVNTASNAETNFASRSRIRNLTRVPASSRWRYRTGIQSCRLGRLPVRRRRLPGRMSELWDRIGPLREQLEDTRLVPQQYAGLLAAACGVPDLSEAIPKP
jgi:hypothetical protein